MAQKLNASMPRNVATGGSWRIRWRAVDPTSGADVAGVTLDNLNVDGYSADSGGTITLTPPPQPPPQYFPPGSQQPGPGQQPGPAPQPSPITGGGEQPPPPGDTTPPVASGTYQPFTSASAINRPIPSPAPVHPDTARMISAANHWLGTGTWLGPRSRGNYFRGDTSKLAKVQVYANANGWVGAGPFPTPMPSWMANLQATKPEPGDAYVHIVDSVTGDVWEMWHTTPPGVTPLNSGFPKDRWNCSAWRHWTAATATTKGYVSAYSKSFVPGTSASRIQVACGLIVPEDFADCLSGTDPGTVIPHALRMGSFCGSNGSVHPRFVPPAGSGDGRQPEGIPCGARVQLDPSIDVSKWPSVVALREPWRSGMKKLLRTMQVYGILQVDSDGGPGAGNLDCVSPASAAKGGDHYPAGFKFPNEVAGYGWGVGDGVDAELMSHFRVVDWTRWTGA